MDLWVVAAAAGAGYLGKYWQNLSLSEKERLLLSSSSRISIRRSQESCNFLQQIRDRTCPLKRLSQENALQGGFYDPFGGDDSVPENDSSSDVVRMAEHLNAQWLSSLPKFTAKETSSGFCSSEMQKSRPLLVSDDEEDHTKESFDLGLWYNLGESEVKPSHSSFDSCFSMDQATDSEEVSSGQSSEMPLLFLTGLAIGMLSKESKRELQEMNEMNEKLDQAMNLVQDLKEELDMKDNFSVKELSLSASEKESSKSEMEKLQLMSRIEAELEAELERLQMDIKRERTSTFFQVKLQSEETITERGYDDIDSESEFNERSDNMTGQVETQENYAVSPRELSIRLHELIESQLEERIKELEKAL